MRRFVAEHAERLDHLRFDVGLDYLTDASGTIVMPKSSYYSTL